MGALHGGAACSVGTAFGFGVRARRVDTDVEVESALGIDALLELVGLRDLEVPHPADAIVPISASATEPRANLDDMSSLPPKKQTDSQATKAPSAGIACRRNGSRARMKCSSSSRHHALAARRPRCLVRSVKPAWRTRGEGFWDFGVLTAEPFLSR